jgi:outer membrane protein OmpA-like peptidoglycan-associated protein
MRVSIEAYIYRWAAESNGDPAERKNDMRRNWTTWLLCVALCFSAPTVVAQSKPDVPASEVVTKTVKAIGYQVGGGSTKVDLKGSELMSQASGEAKVEAKAGATDVEASVKGLAQATTLGVEFMTYVLWAVSTEGRTSNLGQIFINKDGDGKLSATTQMQTFSLFVTAEPYFGVRQPSEMLILENEIRKGTKGKIFIINNYPLMKRSEYQKVGNPLALTLDLQNVPLDVYEARNAVDIAKSHGAEKYAPEIFSKAQSSLAMTENSLASKEDKKVVISTARQTVQFAEDARALAVQREQEESIANARDAAAAKAKAAAEATAAAAAAEAKQKADAEAQHQAELAAAKEDALKAEAEKTRKEAADLRAQLLAQLNSVLQTVDTPRGLVVTMADILFASGKYELSQDANLKLARLSGVILAHPGLKLRIEGYTDSTGGEDFNLKLSGQRADTVRTFLVGQGLKPDDVTSAGMGQADPVASNDTPAGRQQNRRVEIIVSGEAIGTKIGQ